MSHLNWRREFHCSPRLTANHSLTNELMGESEQMEQCLQDWKRELRVKRLQYGQLNHFTTGQLLFLRQELAVVKGRGPRAVDGVPLEVYNLLESVLPGIDPATLKSALVFSGICPQESGQDIIRSYGVSSKSHHRSEQMNRPVNARTLPSSNQEMFQSLVDKLESLGYSEEVAVAAMVSCKDASEADLIVWSVKNSANKELITAKYAEALSDPTYARLLEGESITPPEKKR